jgi:hypothetical protein
VLFLAASTECSAGSNDHFVVLVVLVLVLLVLLPSLVQFDGRPPGGANFHYCLAIVSLMWMKIGSNDITAQMPGVSKKLFSLVGTPKITRGSATRDSVAPLVKTQQSRNLATQQ